MSLQRQIAAIEQGLQRLQNQQREFSLQQRVLQQNTLDVSDRLDSINRNRVETPFYQIPPFDYEIGVPSVTNVEKIAETQDVGVTHLGLTWTGPSDPNVERFEVWAKNVSFQAERPYKVADVTDAPATIQLTSDQDTGVALFMRTIMKNGLSTPLDAAPTVATSITQTPLGAADIADESIGDAKLDRTTDPISMQTADIANAAITNAKIANAAIGTAQIQNAAITNALIANAAIATAQIQNAAITNALIANATITSAKIASVTAASILAGTITSVNMSAGTYTLTSGANQMDINGTQGFRQTFTTPTPDEIVQIFNGTVQVLSGSDEKASMFIQSSGAGIDLANSSNDNVIEIASDDTDLGQANSGYLAVKNNSGTSRVELGVDSGGDGEIHVNGTRVVTAQGATVSDPSGGATVDSEARTAIEAIIDRLQAHGLIA